MMYSRGYSYLIFFTLMALVIAVSTIVAMRVAKPADMCRKHGYFNSGNHYYYCEYIGEKENLIKESLFSFEGNETGATDERLNK